MLILTIKESGSSEDEATAMTIAERGGDSVYHKAAAISTSTQTDRKSEADISTQTDDYDDETTTEGPAEAVVTMGTEASGEDSLNESVVGIAEGVVEDEEPFDDRTAGIVAEEVVIVENNVYDNIVFRAERVEITDNFEMNYITNSEEESSDETEPENAESNSNESSVEGEIVAEGHNAEETVPLEISSSLPKVVADCVEAVFAAVSVVPYFAAVKPSDPSGDEAITEDSDEGAGDMSADGMLTETAEPESNAVTPEVGEANSVSFVDGEPVDEEISEVVCEDYDSTPANGDRPEEQLSLPLVTEILVKVESAHEEVITDDAPTVEDVPGKSEELTIMEGPINELISIEELPEDTLDPPDDEDKPSYLSSPEVIPAEENTVVIGDVGPETVADTELSPVIVIDDAVEIPEEAIEALSQELSAFVPPESAVYGGIPLEEEVITATTFVPLSGELEASLTFPEEPHGTVSEEAYVELMEALSNEVLADVPQTDSTGEPELSVQEELVEDSDAPADALMEDADKETPAPSVAAVEEPTEPNPVTSEEHAEERMSLIEPQVFVVIIEASEDEATEEMMCETENSGDDLVALDENSEDSQIAHSDEPVLMCAEVVLETLAEQIIIEDGCNHVTSEAVAAEIITEGETEEKAEDDTDSTQSTETTELTPATSTDMEAVLFRLQSACTSVLEESAYRLVCLKVSSVGHSVVVTIHVASEEEPQ